MRFPNPLRHVAAGLDAKVAASDAAMTANGGILIERTGRFSRQYRFDPVFLAAKQAEAARARQSEEDQHVREMAERTQQMLAITLEMQAQRSEPGPAIEPRVLALLESDPLAEQPPAPLRAYQVHQLDQGAELTALLDSALTPTGDGRGWRS
jgi:hypothetical protein